MKKNDKDKPIIYESFESQVSPEDFNIYKPYHTNERDKVLIDLYAYIPEDAVGELLEVLKLGALKYGTKNYLEGDELVKDKKLRILNALGRHLKSVFLSEACGSPLEGFYNDSETHCNHMTHVAACALMYVAVHNKNMNYD